MFGGPKEILVILVVLVIVFLVFGPKRIKSLGSELGNAIKGFRKAVRENDAGNEAKAVEHETEGTTADSGATRAADKPQNV